MKDREEQLKMFVIASLLIICFTLSYYFLFILKTPILYTHFFYIPIILACIWWRRKGVFVGLLLIALLLVSNLILKKPLLWTGDLTRIAMFSLVTFLVVALGEKWDKTSKQLKFAKDNYKNFINNSVDAIYMIQDGRFKFTNKRFQNIFGYTKDELSNKKIEELIVPKDLKGAVNNFRVKELAKPSEEVYTFRVKKKDGEIIYVETTAAGGEYQGRSAVQGTFRNITKRKRAEAEIKILSDFNKNILENVPASIMVLDKKGKVVTINRYYERLTGFSKYDKIGVNLLERNSVKNNSVLLENYQRLLNEGKPFFQYAQPFYKKDNSTRFYLNIAVVPLKNRKGEIEGAISIGQDVSQLMGIKDRFRKLNLVLAGKVKEKTRELQSANQELKKIMDFKTKFIADTSHELRTPLTIIKGNLDLIFKNEIDTSDFEEEISNIVEEADKMFSLVEDLTLLSRVDASEVQINKKELRLDELIKRVVERLKHLTEKQRTAIEFGKLPPLVIVADKERLEKLIINLINNAIKYSKNKGAWTRISLASDNKIATILVEDNGIGIPKDDLPYIFDRFYRVEKSRSRKRGGTGLGLAICKWIAEAHGGKIYTKSTPERGSRFYVDLPLTDSK